MNDFDATTSAYGHRKALFMLHYLADGALPTRGGMQQFRRDSLWVQHRDPI